MPKRNEILIIGNGRSVLDNSFGEKINQFPVVGRINNYSTIEFEEYVGHKTDIWFNGANQNLKKRKEMPKEVVVFIPVEILQRKKEKIHDRITKRLYIPKEKYSLIPLDTMERYEKLFIHGFDFFIDSKTHYNENIINKWLIDWGIYKKAGKHNMIAEKQYIEKLIRDNKVTPLKGNLKQ